MNGLHRGIRYGLLFSAVIWSIAYVVISVVVHQLHGSG